MDKQKTATRREGESELEVKGVKYEEDIDAYRTDDMKPPLEDTQCNIAKDGEDESRG